MNFQDEIKNLKDAEGFDWQDLISFGGLLFIGVGASLVYLPAGFIAVGVGLFGIGMNWWAKRIKIEEKEETKEQ